MNHQRYLFATAKEMSVVIQLLKKKKKKKKKKKEKKLFITGTCCKYMTTGQY
jgi:hypothetical protein